MRDKIKIVKINKYNRGTPDNIRYLDQYYAVRAKAFKRAYESDLYKAQPTIYDNLKSTVFFIAVDTNDKVVGGGQFNFSTPTDRRRLKFEISNDKSAGAKDKLKIENLLPHIDIEEQKIGYAEMAGVAIDPDTQDKLLALKLQTAMLDSQEFRDTDIVVGAVTPRNVAIARLAGERVGHNLILRDDIKDVVVNGKFPISILIASPSEKYDVLSPEMKEAKVGEPKDEVNVQSVVANSKILKQESARA